MLHSLTPLAVIGPTALDAVLTRLVLAQGRRGKTATGAEIDAIDAVLAARPTTVALERAGEDLIS